MRPRAAGGAEVCVAAGGRLLIGRDAACDLCVDDVALSRRHAELVQEGAVWFVVDQGSANGTFVDGERVTRAPLRDGAVLRLGPEREFVFSLERPARVRGAGRRLPDPAGLLCLRLVSGDARAGGASLLLGRKLSVIGRDEGADLLLPLAQISGVHARIERRGDRLVLTDAGSRNGTTVNGEAVKERALRVGDRVGFADVGFVVRLSPVPSVHGALLLGVAALVLVGVLLLPSLRPAGARVERLWTKQMYVEQARLSLGDALTAYDGSPPNDTVAKAQFEIAIRSLIAADRLPPDHQSEEELRQAFRETARQLDRDRLRGRDTYALFQELREGRRPPPPPAPAPEPAASTAEAPAPAVPPPPAFSLDEELSRIFAQFGVDTRQDALPVTMVAAVDSAVRLWTVDRRDYTLRTLRRARPYLDMMRSQLEAQGIPQAFCYLPFIESGYQTDIPSPAGAVGLWQLMPGTARDYGLRVDDTVDERTDPARATAAACQYLQDLMIAYGSNDCMCAVAAYNKGDNGLRACLRSMDIDWWSRWKFWDLVRKDAPCLPTETREYVSRFLAAAVVMRRPEQFGLPTD
ncbi:MAG: FHA domain-containing protein [Candidatus Krumholzibacteriia bacterium]